MYKIISYSQHLVYKCKCGIIYVGGGCKVQKTFNFDSFNLSLKELDSKEDLLDDDFEFTKLEIAEFLEENLGKYGDPLGDILSSIDYALSNEKGKGGFILVLHNDDVIVGTVVINDTGMEGYIPEHVLVYIAVDKNFRGKGIGRILLKETIARCDGDISLHVEYDNPARKLYEKIGFESKYAEMRYKS
ncbi:MAG: GCN5-related N-acetyltransferase [Petrotoga mobilis]|nr:MAG: GCN5-related N-acetyltransferase [Petrotoga mobilis]